MFLYLRRSLILDTEPPFPYGRSGPWKSDLLDRTAQSAYLIDFLVEKVRRRKDLGQTGSFVLNIEADWGSGKSFFLAGMRDDLAKRRHLVAWVDAWKDDHADDPLLAFMAAVDLTLVPFVKKEGPVQKAWNKTRRNGSAIALKFAIGATKRALQKGIGEEALDYIFDDDNEAASDSTQGSVTEEIVKAASDAGTLEAVKILDATAEKLVRGFRQTTKTIDSFKKNLGRTLGAVSQDGHRSLPKFVLVDELDRCRPTYAVSLLERIKHFFDVDDVVFVIATDTAQLQHSIRGAYGGEFDGERYLRRFFDLTYRFPLVKEPKAFIAQYIYKIDESKVLHPDTSLENLLLALWKTNAFDGDFRTFLQCLDHCETVITAWKHNQRIALTLLIEEVIKFQIGEGRLSNWRTEKLYVTSYSSGKQEKLQILNYNNELRGACLDPAQYFGKMERGNLSYMQQMIIGVLGEEFNGRIPPRGVQSVLANLSDAVSSAGRFSHASTGDMES